LLSLYSAFRGRPEVCKLKVRSLVAEDMRVDPKRQRRIGVAELRG
jgi:hypothetical protein